MKILAGDIGGTKTLLRISEVKGNQRTVLLQQRFESEQFDSFENLVSVFLSDWSGDDIRNACIGVAGPITESGASVTNLPWKIENESLCRKFCFDKLRLINDFQAVGYGLNVLPSSSFLVLQQGKPQPYANQAVIGAGTGLGEALLIWQNQRYEVLPSEGGHVDFAPRDEQQIQLLRYMLEKYAAVSYELLCSGPGLERIYTFITREQQNLPGITAAQITDAALHGEATAMQALELFVAIYGAQAGNLALTGMATGGVFIAGGIAPRIAAMMQNGVFMKNFNCKSKMQQLLENIPVRLVLDSDVGLLGAEAVAARL